jgi:hypothetical protein
MNFLPAWLWLTTPLKFGLWLANRLVTWAGLFWLWRRWRQHRSVWLRLALVNAASLGLLGGVFFWLWRSSLP